MGAKIVVCAPWTPPPDTRLCASSRTRWCSTRSASYEIAKLRRRSSRSWSTRSRCSWRTRTKRISGKKLTLVPILRAGLGMVEGIYRLVPGARIGHIGLYRDHTTLEPVEYYFKVPGDAAER